MTTAQWHRDGKDDWSVGRFRIKREWRDGHAPNPQIEDWTINFNGRPVRKITGGTMLQVRVWVRSHYQPYHEDDEGQP